MKIRATSAILIAMLLDTSCTVVKPIACGVVHPIRSVAQLFEESSRAPEEPDDTPTAIALIEFPILLPAFFVYKCFVGVVGGLGTGIASDFNFVSGHASWDKTLENLTRPGKTNAAR
jgi:hypothetical protein